MKKRTKHILQLIFLLFLIVGSVYVIMEARRPTPYRQMEGTIFGTTYHITYQSRDDLEHEVLAAMQEVDNSLSMFNPRSTISLINTNKSKATDPLFRKVFLLAMDVAEKTDGAFDITVAPLVNAWGFGFKNKESITPHLIDSLRHLVGYKQVSLTNDMIQKADPRIMLDCSGIAKGFGCDRAAECLRKKGVKNYMVEIGGEIATKGRNGKGQAWTVGIVRPQENNKTVDNTLQAVLQVKECGIATSGNYRNFYYKGKHKYAHTIDPRTGYPVQHSILSSTVTASTSAEADAYATAFMVLGLEKARNVIRKHPEIQAYFIYTDHYGKYQTWCSPSMKKEMLKQM